MFRVGTANTWSATDYKREQEKESEARSVDHFSSSEATATSNPTVAVSLFQWTARFSDLTLTQGQTLAGVTFEALRLTHYVNVTVKDQTFNDGWVTSPNRQAIIDTMAAPKNDKESAIVQSLDPGSYTVKVTGVNNATGVVRWVGTARCAVRRIAGAFDVADAAARRPYQIFTRASSARFLYLLGRRPFPRRLLLFPIPILLLCFRHLLRASR